MSDDCDDVPLITRRRVLGSAGALFALGFVPRVALAAPGGQDLRVLVVVLRGALDGLAAVAPLGDPAYAGLRGALALEKGGPTPAVALDGFFAAHPAMTNFVRLYRARQALVVHAAATGFRSRSHFEAQEVLESGQAGPGETKSGWLNRAFGGMRSLGTIAPRQALGVGVLPPLVVRGSAKVMGWAPDNLPDLPPGLADRVLDLYAARDPELGKVLANGLGAAGIARSDRDGMNVTAHVPGYVRAMRDTAHSVARIMAADDGPRVGALAFGGWDTHANQGAATGQLARLLSGLDTAFGAFETGFGPVWQRTAVVVITEFGRTARVNGTIGSDHGTGTVAVLLGGAVRGGRVLADWPGLGPSQLYENRDLAATTDLRAVLKGVLQQGYDLNESFLANTVFSGTGSVRPMRDLLI